MDNLIAAAWVALVVLLAAMSVTPGQPVPYHARPREVYAVTPWQTPTPSIQPATPIIPPYSDDYYLRDYCPDLFSLPDTIMLSTHCPPLVNNDEKIGYGGYGGTPPRDRPHANR